jgi:hypothetical protein
MEAEPQLNAPFMPQFASDVLASGFKRDKAAFTG